MPPDNRGSDPIPLAPRSVDIDHHIKNRDVSPSNEMSSSSETDEGRSGRPVERLKRPKMPHRMSSGTIIVPRDAPTVEMQDEDYGSDDARTMSPRRTSEELDQLGEKARKALLQQAKELQDSLLQIVDRVETVKTEHEKLEGGNRFLQSYIGELMQTSKLTPTASGKGKNKGKSSK